MTVAGYRAFARAQRFDIRPITLLFGDNNAGKSALLRVLPLVADSVAPTASGPLDLDSPATRSSTFAELHCKAPGSARELVMTFHWDDDEIASAMFALDWWDDWKRLVVRRFEIANGKGQTVLQATWIPRREDRKQALIRYALELAGKSHEVDLGFPGLWPAYTDRRDGSGHATSDAVPGEAVHYLAMVAGRQQTLASRVQWLTATRAVPPRISNLPPGPIQRMRPDGRDAIAVLAFDPELRTEISRWYERHLRRELRILEVPPGSFRITLGGLDVDLIDTGEGMIQVLPVLTALALASRPRQGGSGIVAIEEPESHLHPNLQRALAEHLCHMVTAHPAMRVVLETHSEHVLLAIQLAIARGQIAPEHVLVYWVQQFDNGQSIANPVTFDRDGRPRENWPPGVFSEDDDLARELLRTRRENKA